MPTYRLSTLLHPKPQTLPPHAISPHPDLYFMIPGPGRTLLKAFRATNAGISGLGFRESPGPLNVVPFLGYLSFLLQDPDHKIGHPKRGTTSKGLGRVTQESTATELLGGMVRATVRRPIEWQIVCKHCTATDTLASGF